MEFEGSDDEEAIQVALSAKSPNRRPSSSAGKSKRPMRNEGPLKARERIIDWANKHAVSGPGGKFMSLEENKAATDGSCSAGEFKSSAVIRALEFRSKLEKQFPSFVKSLVRSDIGSCFGMGLPGAFCKTHLPEKDATMTLENESGKQFQVKYLAYKSGLSTGWRQFCASQKLQEGDVIVFQLVGPTKFKVYVIRANVMVEAEGALGLLNLDHHPKQNDAEKGCGESGKVANDNSGKKRRNTLTLSPTVVQKKKRPGLPRTAPRNAAEQSENYSEDVSSDISDSCKSPPTVVPFTEIKSFEDFSIVVDGIYIDSELPNDIRRKYYKLCCSQNAYLHENLIQGMNHNLIVGTIYGTANIAYAIRASKFTSTSLEQFSAWDQTLRAFHLFGMNVGFLRTRLCRLLSIAYEPEDNVVIKRYIEAKAERSHAREEMRNIESKIEELREACERFGNAVNSLRSSAETCEHEFQKEAAAPW